MLDTKLILCLYNNVLNTNIVENHITEEDIKLGIESMQDVYKPGMANLSSVRSNVANYNDPAHRCAYLHKYAAFHTGMVRDMLYEAVQMNRRFFYDLIFSQQRFNICCLGGGPGTDVIGVLAALHLSFSYFETHVTIVDYMVNWSYSFISILRELGSGMYGAFGNNISHFLNWNYVGANLLKKMSPEVADSLSSATLVTMVKFASAAACIDTENMIKNIFLAMKPGAVLFFIDNDAGGYHEIIKCAAREHNFINIFGPIRHENYKNEGMKIRRFGYLSCFKTTVSVHLLQKPVDYDYRFRYLPLRSDVTPMQNPARTVVMSPNHRAPLFTDSPLTPFVYQIRSEEAESNINFAEDKNISDPNNNFHSPPPEIVQSPGRDPLQLASYVASPAGSIINSPLAVENIQPNTSYTPVRRGKKAPKHGCLPLPLKRWKKHLSKKIDQVKSRASSMLRRRPRPSHPVFRL